MTIAMLLVNTLQAAKQIGKRSETRAPRSTHPIRLDSPRCRNSPPDPWSVAQLTRAAKRAVEGSLGSLWIRGEVVGVQGLAQRPLVLHPARRGSPGPLRHVEGAATRGSPKPPQDGQEVFLFGKPSIYEEKGEFQFSALELLLTEALGAQQLAYEKARAALQKDGLFEPSRKRPLPALPRGIAIVTSPDGAALRDIIPSPGSGGPGCRST